MTLPADHEQTLRLDKMKGLLGGDLHWHQQHTNPDYEFGWYLQQDDVYAEAVAILYRVDHTDGLRYVYDVLFAGTGEIVPGFATLAYAATFARKEIAKP